MKFVLFSNPVAVMAMIGMVGVIRFASSSSASSSMASSVATTEGTDYDQHRLLQNETTTAATQTDTNTTTTVEDVFEEEDHDGDCHCDGAVAHCSDAADETAYTASTCVVDCHCDGAVAHCTDTANEAAYTASTCADGASTSSSSSDDKPWSAVIVTCLVVNVATLSGVVFVGGMWVAKKLFPNWDPDPVTGRLWSEVLIPMFACGALLATTMFILFPESYLMVMGAYTDFDPHAGHDHRRFLAGDDEEIEFGEEKEGAATWRWGSSILGGLWIPLVMHACFPHDHSGGSHGDGHDHGHGDGNDGNHTHGDQPEESAPPVVEEGMDANNDKKLDSGLRDDEIVQEVEATTGGSATAVAHPVTIREMVTSHENDDEYVTCACGLVTLKNVPLFLSLNIGEAVHNFTDGIFIGVAWMGCGSEMAYTIALATILHELPNQLAGFFVMVNQNGIPPITALILNFIFGLSILLGGLLVLLFDFSDVTVGCLLAMGGGTFLHVAIGELLQNAERNMTRGIQMLWAFIAFLVGAVPIGLILINHKHC